MNKNASILELRERAKAECRLFFSAEPTEENIMYLVGCYQAGVDTLGAAIGLMQKDWEELDPSEPGNDVQETEEDKATKRWNKMQKWESGK